MSEEMHDEIVTRQDVVLAMAAMTAMREGGPGASEEEIDKVIAEVRRWKVGITLYEFLQERMIEITLDGDDVKVQMTPEASEALDEAMKT